MCLTRFMCYPASFLKFSLVEKPGVLRHFSFKSFPPPATTLMCITVLGRLLPVVVSCASQKTPVIYIVTARKNSALPLLTRVQKSFWRKNFGFPIDRLALYTHRQPMTNLTSNKDLKTFVSSVPAWRYSDGQQCSVEATT